MLVFIDESGDPGFQMTKGSSGYFVVVMVVFETLEAAASTQAKINDLANELGISPEFKFNASRNIVRDAFFQKLAPCQFKVRAIVMQKSLIHSSALREHKESFYKFFLRQLLQHDGGLLANAKIVIDGSGDRDFKSQLVKYLRRSLPRETMAKLELKDSVRDRLIQLADMCAGAIGRSCRTDKIDADKWRVMLQRQGHLSDIWDFR